MRRPADRPAHPGGRQEPLAQTAHAEMSAPVVPLFRAETIHPVLSSMGTLARTCMSSPSMTKPPPVTTFPVGQVASAGVLWPAGAGSVSPSTTCTSDRPPAGPAGPCGPAGPVSPVAPFGPAGPVAPVAPFGPAGPVAPVGPCGPAGPVLFQFRPVSPLLQCEVAESMTRT